MPEAPPIQPVVVHTPGPSWDPAVDFRHQPGIMDHVNHYRQLLDQGRLLLGGPFLDAGRGGMMISQGMTVDDLEAFAQADPAVKAGLLEYRVLSWYVAMRDPRLEALS